MLSAEQLAAYYLQLQQQWPKAVWDKINQLTEAYRKSLGGLPPSEQSVRSFLRGSSGLLPAGQTDRAIIAVLIGLLRPAPEQHSGGVNTTQLQMELKMSGQMMKIISDIMRAQGESLARMARSM